MKMNDYSTLNFAFIAEFHGQTMQHYTSTQIKVKKQRLHCCSTVGSSTMSITHMLKSM